MTPILDLERLLSDSHLTGGCFVLYLQQLLWLVETIPFSLQVSFVIAQSSGILLLRIFVPPFIFFTNLHNRRVG